MCANRHFHLLQESPKQKQKTLAYSYVFIFQILSLFKAYVEHQLEEHRMPKLS